MRWDEHFPPDPRIAAGVVGLVLLDVHSPEGGTLDGIIGMNLFTDFNFVLRGGGLFLQEDPRLELKYIGDWGPADVTADGVVDNWDLKAMAAAWLATPSDGNWNQNCDIAPAGSPDNKINLLDLAILAQYWTETTAF